MLLVLMSTLMGWLFSSSRAYLALNRKKSISSAAASISAWMTVLPCRERSHQIKALKGGRGGGNAAAMSRSGAAQHIQMWFVGCVASLTQTTCSLLKDVASCKPPSHHVSFALSGGKQSPCLWKGTLHPPVFPHSPSVPPWGKPGLLGHFARVNSDNRSP